MKICFWGKIADALQGRTGGGGELQIALMAKTLAGLGHEVVVVDLDTEEDFFTADGIRVCPVRGYNKGIRGLRTFTHRLPGLYSTFKEINADIYYCRIREYRHIIVYMAARKVKAKFIMGLASDLDILSIRKRWRHFYSSNVKDLWGVFNGLIGELVYPFLLSHADCVFVQHYGQKELLREKRIDSVVFPNVIDPLTVPAAGETRHNDFVYVGSLDKRKGFADFFRIVQMAPEYSFRIIGSPRDKTGAHYYERFKSFRNVKLTGRLSHEETLRQVAGARALISTSPMEGFPNVFIEAWACGVPVISLYVDPGDIIEREQIGINAHGDLKMMAESLESIGFSEAMAARARLYIRANHELNTERKNELGSLFSQVYKGRSVIDGCIDQGGHHKKQAI